MGNHQPKKRNNLQPSSVQVVVTPVPDEIKLPRCIVQTETERVLINNPPALLITEIHKQLTTEEVKIEIKQFPYIISTLIFYLAKPTNHPPPQQSGNCRTVYDSTPRRAGFYNTKTDSFVQMEDLGEYWVHSKPPTIQDLYSLVSDLGHPGSLNPRSVKLTPEGVCTVHAHIDRGNHPARCPSLVFTIPKTPGDHFKWNQWSMDCGRPF